MQDKKVILITGCSSGIGFVTAIKFASKGYTVYAGVRNEKSDGAQRLLHLAEEQSLDVQLLRLDITSEKNVLDAISLIEKKEGKIDVLVNNAGFGALGPLEAFSIEEIKEQYETNVFGTIRMIQAVAPLMRKKKSGYIVNIGSINGLVAFPLWGVYASSKFAIEAFTEALRFELAQFGIKVLLIEPGSFDTDFTKNRKMPKSLENENSPYIAMVKNFFKQFDKMGEKAKSRWIAPLVNPQRVANKIYSLVQQSNPPLHNRIGIDSHLYYFAKKIIPAGVMNLMLKKVYFSD